MSAPELPSISKYKNKEEYDRAVRAWLRTPYPTAAKLKAAVKGSRRVSAE